jgi:hypothetical protein
MSRRKLVNLGNPNVEYNEPGQGTSAVHVVVGKLIYKV